MEITILEERPVKVQDRQCRDIFNAVLVKLCADNEFEVDDNGEVWALCENQHNGDTCRGLIMGRESDPKFRVMMAARQLADALRDELKSKKT